MIDSSGKNLVFLLSVPRSGSSLVTTILQNHSKVFATQEMWYLMSLYDLQNPLPRAYHGTEIIQRFFNSMISSPTFDKASRNFAIEVYNGLLHTSGSQMIVDKSPRYYYLLEYLDRLFPHSQRVWLIRSPLGVLSSYKKVSAYKKERFNVEDVISNKFNINMLDITVGLFRYYDYFRDDNSFAYHLKYEDLVHNPRQQLEELCYFLNISYEKGMEVYGDLLESSKGKMYTSMGVGDPFLFKYRKPHQESINSWKEVLTKQEVEIYCRVLGSSIFHELGYSDQLAEAEEYTGVHFESGPDTSIFQMRMQQLVKATGCKWENQYKMNTNHSDDKVFFKKNDEAIPKMDLENQEVQQLKIALGSLENRLDKSYKEQDRLRYELFSLREKIDKMKSIIPFSSYLAGIASNYFIHNGRKQ